MSLCILPADRGGSRYSGILVRLLFYKGRSIGGVNIFFNFCPSIILLIDGSCQANERLTKALLAFLITNIVFYLPEILIDRFEALDERGVDI